MTETTYKIDTEHLTVLATGPDGEVHDLNADGEPCETLGDLHEFVWELRVTECITGKVAGQLHREINEAMRINEVQS